MSGLAGVMTADGSPPEPLVLTRLGSALAHRGPGSRERREIGGFGLVEVRREAGDGTTRPGTTQDGAAVALDGRIYNASALRAELGDDAPQDGSERDLLRHLQRRHGAGFASSLRGMYAAVVFDPGNEILLLARDPFGIKPLYYVEGPRGFAFASEAQALIAAELTAGDIGAEQRDELLQLQFNTGRETIHPNIRRVLPGETLTISSGRIVARSQRQGLPDGRPTAWSEADALKRLDAALIDSIAAHLPEEGPFSLFFSGGIPSAVLLAAMVRLGRPPEQVFMTSVAEPVAGSNRAMVRCIADSSEIEEVEVAFGEQAFWATLPEVAAVLDDPAADYAAVPAYLFAQAAAPTQTIVLVEEGGNELFAGYGRYRGVVRPWYLGGPKAMRPRGRFDRLEVLRHEPVAWRDGIHAAESLQNSELRSGLQVAQAVDCVDWLPNDVLLRLDRCLVVHGLEARSPFLDPVLAEVAFSLPDGLKVRNGMGLYLLRRWLDNAVPALRPFVRKRAAGIPVMAWLAERGAALGPLVANQPGVAEVAKPDRVNRLFRSGRKREGFAAWSLLFYALWHRRHVLGLAPAGDVFETLAS